MLNKFAGSLVSHSRLSGVRAAVNFFGHRSTVASRSSCHPRNYSQSSKDNGDSTTDSSSSSSDEDEEKKPKVPKRKLFHEPPEVKSALSSDLIGKILSMKVTGARPSDTPVSDGNRSPITPAFDLAKPSGKFRQIRKTLEKENEAERELEKSGLNKELIMAVRDVATSLPGDAIKIESQLLSKLKDYGLESKANRAGVTTNLSETVAGMKVDRKQRTDSEQRPTRQAAGDSFTKSIRSMRGATKVDLFGAPPLGIFTAEATMSKEPVSESDGGHLSTQMLWERLEQRELDLLVTHPPVNGFEEMIKWTKDGKLWHFPIDNEQGMEEEAKVGFHEHVFLEPLLEDGFPRKGPIRHFMELVIVGLSKNPYLSVAKKRDHIDWFRQYFKENERILKEAIQ